MKIPKRIKIGAQIYKVIPCRREGRESRFGSIDAVHLELRLADEAEPTRQEQTLIHEIVEGINIEYDVGLKHHQIELLEIGIYRLLCDNPAMFDRRT